MPDAAVHAEALFIVHPARTGSVMGLQGLSIAAAPGELVAVVGPSGSGKSTLLQCLSGARRPTSGSLHVFGRRLHDASPRALAEYRATTVAVMDQDPARALPPTLTIGEAIALPLRIAGASARRARRTAASTLDDLDLSDIWDALPAETSGGQQHRAALAAALVRRPRLLLADEPTGQLDDAAARSVLELLRRAASDGTTVVIVTHDERVAAEAERVVHVRDGRVSAVRTASDNRRRVVIDPGGVVRIDPDDLDAAGVGATPLIQITDDGLLLRRARRPPPTPAAPEARPHDAPDPAATLTLRSVYRTYGRADRAKPVLRGIDGQWTGGCLTAVAGPSGSGKTALLHLVAGLDQPDSGDIVLGGRRLVALSREQLAALRRDIVGIVPQAAALVPYMSAREHVELAATTRGCRRADAVRRAEAALAEVGLSEIADRPTEGLSAGERQRAAIARALVGRPSVLLADEPTANLDERNARAVSELLRRHAHEQGALVMCATHDTTLLARADNVLSLRDGRIADASRGAPALRADSP